MARRSKQGSPDVALHAGICAQCGYTSHDTRKPGNAFWVLPYLCSACAPRDLVEQTRIVIHMNLPYLMAESLKPGDPMPPNLSASCEWGLHAICDDAGRMRTQQTRVGKDGIIRLPNDLPPPEPCDCDCHESRSG